METGDYDGSEMVEASPVAAALLLVFGAVGAVPVAALAGSEAGAQQVATDGNESVAPGEQFAGVVGVQQAEVSSEVDARAFGQRVAAAGSNRSSAGVVAAEVGDLDERLADLESQLSELERAHENGTVSEGQYRARLAKLHAEQRAIERRLNQTEQVARRLPSEALEAKGVNATAIDRLRTKAGEMTGPEVAAVARSIAGKNAGKGMGGPAAAGPPAFAGNRTGANASDAPGNGNAGPPADAGPGAETGPPSAAGPNDGAQNESGPPTDVGLSGAGPSNDTGGANDAGSDGEAGPPADAGPGNETAGGNGEAGSNGAGFGAENVTSGGDAAGNATSGDSAGNADGGSDGGTGSNGADTGDTGRSSDGGADEGAARSAVPLFERI